MEEGLEHSWYNAQDKSHRLPGTSLHIHLLGQQSVNQHTSTG